MLVLVPTFLGIAPASELFPQKLLDIVSTARYFVVENSKTARQHLKYIHPGIVQSNLVVHELDKHRPEQGIRDFLAPAAAGETVVMMSEAGVPGVADPGSLVVAEAHRMGIRVVPLVGPSSLLLALMASGLNGQQFAFNGYLPVEAPARKKAWQALEARSLQSPGVPSTQFIIETPYRNGATWESALASLQPETRLCVAADLTLSTEWISMRTVREWRTLAAPNLHKRPCIFLIQAAGRR
jgi:16S rRNA (cytidine1402-2'-O)-methyltransferase